MPDRIRSDCAFALAAIIALVASEACAQISAPTNSTPNPYRSIEHYLELAGRVERLAFEVQEQSQASSVDLLEAAQFIRDTVIETNLRSEKV